MRPWEKPSMAAQAAAAMILIQLFFKFLFEMPRASMVVDRPLILRIVYILAAVWVLLIPFCLTQVRKSFILGVIFGLMNAILSLIMLLTGRTPSPNIWHPIFVTVQNVLIVYFCYRALKDKNTSYKH